MKQLRVRLMAVLVAMVAFAVLGSVTPASAYPGIIANTPSRIGTPPTTDVHYSGKTSIASGLAGDTYVLTIELLNGLTVVDSDSISYPGTTAGRSLSADYPCTYSGSKVFSVRASLTKNGSAVGTTLGSNSPAISCS